MGDLHNYWVGLVVAAEPFLGPALITQLFRAVDMLLAVAVALMLFK